MYVHLSAVTTGQTEIPCNMSERGSFNIIGIETDNLVAGRLEMCDGSTWRAVYDESWDSRDVILVCQEKGFPIDGELHIIVTVIV